MPFLSWSRQANSLSFGTLIGLCLLLTPAPASAGPGGGAAGAGAAGGGAGAAAPAAGGKGAAVPPMGGGMIRGGGGAAGALGGPAAAAGGGGGGLGGPAAGASSPLGTTASKPALGPMNNSGITPRAAPGAGLGAAGAAAGTTPLGKTAVQGPSRLGSAAPPARFDADPGTIVPNVNGVGYYGQFTPGVASPFGNYNPMNLNAPFMPSYGPNINFNNQPAFVPPPMFTQPMPALNPAECIQGIANMITGQSQLTMMQNMADDANERMGPRRHRSFNRKANQEILSTFPSPQERGCQKFIDEEGNLGPWGDTLLDCMRWEQNRRIYGYKDEYGRTVLGKVPTDVMRYCPSFEHMSPERRDRFWVWFFMSVAGPESSCNPGAVGQGPNGAAIGLFQLEADKCIAVHVPVSSSDLQRPEPNIRCACSRFAQEMRNRDTIFIGTSQGRAGTYWGTLRSDMSSAQDAPAHQKTMRALASYPDCYK